MNAGTVIEHHPNESPPKESSVSVPGIISVFHLGVLALVLLATGWLVHASTTKVEQLPRLFLMLTVSAAIAGILAGILLVFMSTRHLEKGRGVHQRAELADLRDQLTAAGKEAQRSNADREALKAQLKDLSANIEATIQARINQITSAQEQLEKQLRDRQKAERMMSMQTKELERSKDLLELHVQNRTLEIQKLQQRYESMLNSAGEGIYGLDPQGRINFVNPATAVITGWKPDELTSRYEGEVFLHNPNAVESMPGGSEESRTDCETFFRKDGSSFPIEYTRAPITEGNRVIGTVVVFKDITERKRAEETLNRKASELARSNAELEQFAYVASHDLQEPLRKIQAFGDRLKAKVDAVGLKDGRDYLDRMQSAAARMSTLISDLLTFSRVISASQPFVPVDLNAVVKGVLSDLEVRIEQTGAKVEVENLPAIEADPMQMRQLLQNLIGNALKFRMADRPPQIRITGSILKNPYAGSPDEDPYAEQCQLRVQDNGIGFEEKYSEKIFAVFQRLHGRTEFEGTGVGLAVCRRITDRHGGIIQAHSKPGEGATFTVTVPVRHPKKAPGSSS